MVYFQAYRLRLGDDVMHKRVLVRLGRSRFLPSGGLQRRKTRPVQLWGPQIGGGIAKSG